MPPGRIDESSRNSIPAGTVLGPEAIQELGIKVGHLVRHLAAATGRRRQEAEMRVIEHNPDEDETDYGDEDEESGVVLEELDDDE